MPRERWLYRETVEYLVETLRDIERRLDSGTYRPGQWAKFVRSAVQHPHSDRLAISDQVSRVSDKLHLRKGWRSISFSQGIAAETGAAVIGGVLLWYSVASVSNAFALLAAIILATAFQPVVKIAVGYILGIRYSYTYFWYIEPRFKMRYGTYLVRPRWRRVLFHLSGAVGSPLAFRLVAFLATPTLPLTALICQALFWATAATQIIPLAAGIFGLRPFGMRRLSRLTSAGLAGIELREGFRASGPEDFEKQ